MSRPCNKFIYKWDLKSKGFAEFRDAVEDRLPLDYKGKETNKLEKILRKTIIKAAEDRTI